jgi:hypothetical protein
MAYVKVYLDGDGTPEGTVLADYYQRYQQERKRPTIPLWKQSALRSALLEHLEEFQAELKDYMAVLWPDPPNNSLEPPTKPRTGLTGQPSWLCPSGEGSRTCLSPMVAAAPNWSVSDLDIDKRIDLLADLSCDVRQRSTQNIRASESRLAVKSAVSDEDQIRKNLT